jgi:hypothetical protein
MYTEIAATVAKDGNVSGAIDISDMIAGDLLVPAALESTTTICFKGCNSAGGTFVGIKDEFGTLVSIPATINASFIYEIPNTVMKNKFIKIWTATAAGVDVSQTTAARNFVIIAKG